jgi:hypothetical protein
MKRYCRIHGHNYKWTTIETQAGYTNDVVMCEHCQDEIVSRASWFVRLTCFILGHKLFPTDYMYQSCSRCGDGVDDNDPIETTLKTIPIKIKWWSKEHSNIPPVVGRCYVCEKPRRVLWLEVGDHSICREIPF